MAATTSLLGLVTPTQGDLSGTWGNTVNNGITEYVDIAVAGTLTLTGDGAVTLANTLGSASASLIVSTLAGAGTVTAQFAIVKVSGTTTTKVVTGPSYSKSYIVDNSSSFAVTFKASGQTGVSIAAGEKVTVFYNSAVSNADYVKIAGTIANAAGSNTQVQFNSSGLFGASANLTWSGTALAVTGTVAVTGALTATLDSTFSSTGALIISKGTTGQRPTAASGMLRFNTTTTEFEGYNGTAWASVGGAALSNDTSTATNVFPLFANATTGTASTLFTSNAKFLYKPSTGELSSSVVNASNGIYVNSQSIAVSYTIAVGYSAMSSGPVTIASGQSVTVSSGSRWVVV
jgi:hypothetical protein